MFIVWGKGTNCLSCSQPTQWGLGLRKLGKVVLHNGSLAVLQLHGARHPMARKDWERTIVIVNLTMATPPKP